MQELLHVGFIGGGNMAGAMIDAMLRSDCLPTSYIHVFDPNAEICECFASKGVSVAVSNEALILACDLIVLAVKPQVVPMVLPELAGKLNDKCLVSIAAGISVDSLRSVIGAQTYYVRVLPNTPMLVMKGASVIAKPEACPDKFLNAVVEILTSAGCVEFLDESQINSVIPVSSSSPAFFFRFIRAMAECGEKNGIPYDVSLKLAVETMHGAAHMLSESGKTPDELISQVSSKGGTTVAALTAFDDHEFENMMEDAFARCIKRADELGRS